MFSTLFDDLSAANTHFCTHAVFVCMPLLNYIVLCYNACVQSPCVLCVQGKTGFGMPRNNLTAVEFADDGKRWTIEQMRSTDATVRLQSGTNQFESQKVVQLTVSDV